MSKRVIVRSVRAKKSGDRTKRETDSIAILALMKDGMIDAVSRLPICQADKNNVRRDLVEILELCYATAARHGISEGELNHARVKTRHEEGTFDDGWTTF